MRSLTASSVALLGSMMQKKDQPTLTTFQYFSLQRPEEKGRSNPGGAGSECHESGCWADLRFCGSHRLWHSICACVLAATHVWAILAMNGRWIVSMVFAPAFNFDNENSLSIAQTHPVCLLGLPNLHKSIRGEEVRDFRPLNGTSAQRFSCRFHSETRTPTRLTR